MIDQQNVERAAERFQLPEGSFERLELRRDRKRRSQRIRAGVLGVAIAIAVGWLGVSAIRSTAPVPGGDGDTVTPPPPPQGIFSEVGGWIVFQGEGALRAIAPDGSDETTLLDERELTTQDWSPDGSRLLLTRWDGRLSVIEPDGSETTLLRFDDDTFFTGASFSPDGSTVVYTVGPSAEDGPFQMWTVASDGSGKPSLVLESDHADAGETPGGVAGFTLLYQPAFSPDGSQIAYVDGWYDSRHSLRVVAADGTDVRVLFDATTPPFDEAGHVRGVEWSPDGSLLAISGGHGINTVRPDGTDLRLLIPEAALFAWSPDGSLIAYSPDDMEHSEGWGVWVANADGSNPRMISATGQVGPWNPGGPAGRT